MKCPLSKVTGHKHFDKASPQHSSFNSFSVSIFPINKRRNSKIQDIISSKQVSRQVSLKS